MVRKEELTYKSRDRQTTIHAIKWIPEGQPVAILQIIHGMQEFIDRYDEFARFLAEKGILVMGNDHLGHGKSISETVPYGFFCKNDPATVLVRDAHRLKKMVQEEYPGVPIFILGHSFGSFVAREYIARYGTGIQGAIIQGTAYSSIGTVNSLAKMISFMEFMFGTKKRSDMINNMAFKGYLKRIPNPRTKFDWLSHNEESVDKYIQNPADNFVFTLNGFGTMAELIKRVQDEGKMEDIPKNLPILITAGKEDPVGEYGAGPQKLYDIYKNQLQLQKVDIKIYDGMSFSRKLEESRFLLTSTSGSRKWLKVSEKVDTSKIMVRCAYHSDWDGAMDLAWHTFERFDAPDYSREGIKNFYNFVHDDMLQKMFLAGQYQLFVATEGGKCVGMITLRERKHISLLFVDGNYHGNGIGSALIRYVAKYALDEEGVDKLTVNSSPYAVRFYHGRGFRDNGPETTADGIRYTPMELKLSRK